MIESLKARQRNSNSNVRDDLDSESLEKLKYLEIQLGEMLSAIGNVKHMATPGQNTPTLDEDVQTRALRDFEDWKKIPRGRSLERELNDFVFHQAKRSSPSNQRASYWPRRPPAT